MAPDDAFTRALLSLIEHSVYPMVLSDPHLPDAPLVAANAAFCTLTGYDRDAIIGRNCRFLQGSNTEPDSAKRIRDCLAMEEGCVEWIVNYRKDGTQFWNLLFISPVFDASGALRYHFGNQMDITTGPPLDLAEFQLGPARMPPQAQAAFLALVQDIAANSPDAALSPSEQARAMERVMLGARELNELTVNLATRDG